MFLTTLYRILAADREAFGLVAEDEGKVIGFIAFTTDIRALYRSILRQARFRFVRLLAGALFSWKRSRRILETLRYPGQMDQQTLPRAELLALAVQTGKRRAGIGRQLVEQGLGACAQRGLPEVKVCVGERRVAARALYGRLGFQPVCDLRRHEQTSQIWVKNIKLQNAECQHV